MTKIKWLIKELIAIYSDQPSYFSKKRIESGIAFFLGVSSLVCYMVAHHATITNGEVVIDSTLLFAVAGYAVNQIQSEKKDK